MADLETMFGSLGSKSASKRLSRLTKQHGGLLNDDEQFVGICDGFAADQPDPAWRLDRLPTEERLSLEGAAHYRIAAVRAALGMETEEFTDLPRSSTGYMLAHSESRLFVFDGTGKQYLTEAVLNEVWLQPIEHPDGLYTLVFKNGDERVAVATKPESVELTQAFIKSFPDRRGQARILTLADQSTIADF